MLLEQVLSLFSFSSKKKATKGSKRRLFLLPPSKEEAIRLAIQEAENFKKIKNFKDAIRVLNESIQQGKSSNKLLLKKALLLSDVKQFEESQSILKKLSKAKGDAEISNSAKEALKTVKQLEAEIFNSKLLLIKNMFALANKSNQKLIHTPQPNQLSADHDLALIVRKEAANARNNNRFTLSLKLIDCAFESGIKSPWLSHQKGLTLKAIGKFEEARLIWEKLSKMQNKQKLEEAIKETLDKLDADKDKFTKERPKRLIRHCNAITEDHGWTNQLLPESTSQEAISNPKQLVIDEAKAALQSKKLDLCIELLEASFLYYTNNRQGMLVQAEGLYQAEDIDKAFQILKKLATTKDDKYARKAKAMLSSKLTEKAKTICLQESPNQAIIYYIEQYLTAELNPEYDQGLNDILIEAISPAELSSDPELRKHQLRLKFNNIFINHLEAKLIAQSSEN